MLDGPNGLDDLEDLDKLYGLNELDGPGNDGLDGLEEFLRPCPQRGSLARRASDARCCLYFK